MSGTSEREEALNGPMTEGDDDEASEMFVEATEDGYVSFSGTGFDDLFRLEGQDWELQLTPDEARSLAEALLEAADDAEDALSTDED
jgi:hypothetical protein